MLLLLHGWTVTADLNWFTAYQPLAGTFRVVAMDHRGHGRGIRSWRPFRLEDCADDAAALARELGIDRLVPVGYSMGGAVAQLLWRRHPELVGGLVLCATSRSFAGQGTSSQVYFSGLLGLSLAARLTPAPVRRQVTDSIVRRRIRDVPFVDWCLSEMQRNDTAAVLQAGWSLGQFRSYAWIGGVAVPTAVVVTLLDEVVRPRRQLGLAEAIPAASVHRVQGDHASCVAHPERFLPPLLEACTTVTGARPDEASA